MSDTYSPYRVSTPSSNKFSAYRLGTAAAATTPPGQTPAYGTALDLATAQWANSEQFSAFARDSVAINQKAQIAAAEAAQAKTLHDLALERALNWQESGLDTEDDASNFTKAGNFLKQVFFTPKRVVDQMQGDADPEKLYRTYNKAGGLLTRDEFTSLDSGTQSYLATNVDTMEDFKTVLKQPGISQAVAGLGYAYRGTQTPFIMMGNSAAQNPDGVPFNIANVASLGIWFNGDNWSQAWRESQDQSLGAAIINTQLRPYVSADTLDEWAKHNSLYQSTAFATEFGVGWYADPLVIGGQGLGAASRVSKNAMPLKQDSGLSVAMRQSLQGESITTKNPVTRAFADWRAQRMIDSQQGVNEYLKNVTFGEASQLPMARNSQHGQPLMFALHWANNRKPGRADEFLASDKVNEAMGALGREKDFEPGELDLVDLTWRMGHADPKAYAVLNKLKTMVPEDLEAVAGPGARTFIDAMEATKTLSRQLETEIADLEKIGASGSRFHRWEVDTEVTLKQAQLDEATNALKGYEGYGDWLSLMGTKAGDKALPLLNQVKAPKAKTWNGVEKRHSSGISRFFMDNQFGKAHTVREMPRATWIMKANTASMHDLDSGVMSLNRQAEQFKHLFNYEDNEALESALAAWSTAPTNYDRYKVMHEFEETHLIRGAAQRFGVSEDLIRAIFNKINDERNATIRGVLSGKGSVFSSAPSTAQRAANPDDHSVTLLARNEDTGTVQIQVMDGPNHKVTMTIPDAALVERVAPIDPTQTPNYYTPLDTRQFFYQLKRHEDLLQEFDKGVFANAKAGTMEAIDAFGTAFNSFWKPLQLWRLGWPQRVLMDEGMRAMSVYGPMYWITGPGADAAITAGRNIPSWGARKLREHRKGKVELGAGPLTRAGSRETDPFVRQAEVREAIQLPEVLWPKIDASRHAAITGFASSYASWKRAADKASAWEREYLKASGEDILDLPRRAIRNRAALDFNQGSWRHRNPAPAHPVHKILKAHQTRWQNGPAGQRRTQGPKAYDPVTGATVNKGFVIPLPNVKPFKAGGPDQIADARHREQHSAAFWYEQNAEMLSRSGMRLIMDEDGNLTVAKWFNSAQQGKANEWLQYAADVDPDAKMWDLGRGHSIHIADRNKLTPFTEAVYREFSSEAETARVEGKSPAEGVPPVYHGSSRRLPEDLLPKEQVPVVHGNMIGAGLYTSVSEELASTYGAGNVYTIRGSKSGKQYKVFDLDRPITPAELDDFEAWINANADRFNLIDAEDGSNANAMVDLLLQGNRRSYATARAESSTWANAYEAIDANAWNSHDMQKALHEYLQTKYNAGALTHKGGTSTSSPHQVYVWLHPEDLIVKPVYDKTGKYIPLIDWLDHPSALENAVPENRVVRTGTRNPMLRELQQIGNKLDNWKGAKASNPEYRALVVREQDFMSGLGLEYRHNLSASDPQPRTSPLLSDRYYVKDEGRFARIHGEAKAADVARTRGNIERAELAYRAADEELALAEAWNDFDFQIDSVFSRVGRKIMSRRELGGGFTTLRSSDGREVVTKNAFEGHQGQLVRGLTGSNKTIDILSEGHGGAMSLARRQAQGHKTFHPPVFSDKVLKKGTKENKQAIMYFQRWADMVNDQVGNSPIWSKMLKGWSNERIARWLDETPEGAQVRREVMPEARTSDLWVLEHRQKLDYYLPSAKLQRLLAKGRLEPSDLRKNVHNDDLPDIFGPDLEVLDKRRGTGQFLHNMAEKIWTSLGTVPIDALSRHPFAKASYDAKMRSLIASTDSKWLDADTLERMQSQAHAFAMQQVKRTLWDLTDQTNFTDALRFIAPFWGAQQEAITKWLRIISDRPETVARFFNGQRAAYNNFVVVDREGQEVDSARRKGGLHNLGIYHPDDRVIVQLPGALAKGPLATIGSLGIPVGSANTVLQGELPLMPGPGPMVTIPVDKFLRTISDTYGTTDDEAFLYRWLFPIGRPSGGFRGVMEQLSPGWGRRAMSASSGEDDVAKANLFMQTAREMYLKAERDGKPMPSNEDVAKQARWIWGLRMAAGLTMPVQMEFRPKNQFFLDEYHRYQREYGANFFDKFLDDYGDEMASYAASSSNSEVGVPPTSQGMEEWSGNKRLIAKYPEWGSAIISPDAYTDEFSYDAYKAQFDITLGPGNATKLRSMTSPNERFATTDERVGWREFRKFQSAVDAELFARGLTSIQQSGAEDLQALKRSFLADLTSRNKAWREAYDNQANDIYSRVYELEQFAFRPEFDKRPDMQGARQYLIIRDQVAAQLDGYAAATGGSRSLQAQENGALREWFYAQVGSLIMDNPAFGEFYSRYLDGDTLEQGGGGF